MTDKIIIELTKEELEILVHAVGSSSPISSDLELLQYKIYHRLLDKLKNEE